MYARNAGHLNSGIPNEYGYLRIARQPASAHRSDRMWVHSMKSVVFYLGLALLFTHELDSMPNHEWRVMPILNSLSDSTGKAVFLLAHVPIFAVVVAYIASLDQKIRARARGIFCGFLVAHTFLHYFFSGNAAYEFTSAISLALIYGAGLCGALYFLGGYISRHEDPV